MKALSPLRNFSKDVLCVFYSSFQSRKAEGEQIERTINEVKDLPLREIEKKLGIDAISERPSNKVGHPQSMYYSRPRKLSDAVKEMRRDRDTVDSFLRRKIKV